MWVTEFSVFILNHSEKIELWTDARLCTIRLFGWTSIVHCGIINYTKWNRHIIHVVFESRRVRQYKRKVYQPGRIENKGQAEEI